METISRSEPNRKNCLKKGRKKRRKANPFAASRNVVVVVVVHRQRQHHARLSVQKGCLRPPTLPPLKVRSPAHERPPAGVPLFFSPPPPPPPPFLSPFPQNWCRLERKNRGCHFEEGGHTKRRRFVSSRDKMTLFQFFIFIFKIRFKTTSF